MDGDRGQPEGHCGVPGHQRRPGEGGVASIVDHKSTALVLTAATMSTRSLKIQFDSGVLVLGLHWG